MNRRHLRHAAAVPRRTLHQRGHRGTSGSCAEGSTSCRLPWRKKLFHRCSTGSVIVSDTITPSTAANPAPPNHSAAANGTIPIDPMKLNTPASTPTAAFSSHPQERVRRQEHRSEYLRWDQRDDEPGDQEAVEHAPPDPADRLEVPLGDPIPPAQRAQLRPNAAPAFDLALKAGAASP